MIAAPSGGDLIVDRYQGVALFYEFSIEARNWVSSAGLLRYQYFYLNTEGATVPFTQVSQDATLVKTVLPPTQQLSVKVIDELDGATFFTLPVDIRFQSAESIYP